MAKLGKIRIEMGDVGSGRVFVHGAIDGLEQEFFLDTGSSETFIHAVDEFKSRSIIETGSYFSASGHDRQFDYVRVGSLEIGSHATQNFQVGLIRDLKVEPPKLGLNFFKPHRVTFNFIKQLIEEPDAAVFGAPFSYGPKGHIQISVSVGNQEITCLFDTGAGLSVIDNEFIAKHREHFQLVDAEGTVGDGNEVKMQAALYIASQLRINEIDFSGSNIVGVNLDFPKAALGVEHLIILGFNHMNGKKWTFDFPALRFEVN